MEVPPPILPDWYREPKSPKSKAEYKYQVAKARNAKLCAATEKVINATPINFYEYASDFMRGPEFPEWKIVLKDSAGYRLDAYPDSYFGTIIYVDLYNSGEPQWFVRRTPDGYKNNDAHMRLVTIIPDEEEGKYKISGHEYLGWVSLEDNPDRDAMLYYIIKSTRFRLKRPIHEEVYNINKDYIPLLYLQTPLSVYIETIIRLQDRNYLLSYSPWVGMFALFDIGKNTYTTQCILLRTGTRIEKTERGQ